MRKKPYRMQYPNAYKISRYNKSVALIKIKEGYAIEIRDMKPSDKSTAEVKKHGMRIIQLLITEETATDLFFCTLKVMAEVDRG